MPRSQKQRTDDGVKLPRGHWVTRRKPTLCAGCRAEIKPGDRAYVVSPMIGPVIVQCQACKGAEK